MHRHAKFDLARRMTSLAVLLTHVFQVFWRRFFTIDDPYRYAASTIARHSVLIFFLLSGYLIALSIFGNRERHSRFDVAEYATTRAARIWPPLLGSVFVVLICYALITYLHLPGGSTPYGVAGDQSVAREVFTVSYAEIISSLLLLGGLGTANAPLWSLYFEAWLYVAAALLALAFFSGSMIFRIASSVSAAIFFVILVSIKHTFLFYTFVWFIGAGSCIAVHKGTKNMPKVALGVAILAFVGLCVVSPTSLLVPIRESPKAFLAQGIFAVIYAYVLFFW
ncbi:MAG: acyltransferase family protein, partial [Paraburkholderia fungorum]|nr:acyltransferase family protein [Paraburkholderia fungorum]